MTEATQRTLHALVVEDSPPMRKMIVFALSRIRELTVVEADDGVDALRRIAGTRFDIIVTDVAPPVEIAECSLRGTLIRAGADLEGARRRAEAR